MPKGGGAQTGLEPSVHAQDFTGTFRMSIPLPLPQSPGLNPSLSLDYDSGGGNGIFGLGFSMPLAQITRSARSGIPRYDSRDVFELNSAGELVPCGSPENRTIDTGKWLVQRYRPRADHDYSLIEQWQRDDNSHWRVMTRAGLVKRFGLDTSSRVFDENDKCRIFSWLIDDEEDASGNSICYVYSCDCGAARYPDRIKWGNYKGGRDRHAFDLSFDYGCFDYDNPEIARARVDGRVDSFSSFHSGFESRTSKLCRGLVIQIAINDQPAYPISALRLTYDVTSAISLLASIKRYGYRGARDNCQIATLPPLSLGYTPFKPEGRKFRPLDFGSSQIKSFDERTFNLVDLDGDGLPGLLHSDGINTLFWPPLGEGRFGEPSSPSRFPSDRTFGNGEALLLPLDGNGRHDVVVCDPPRFGFYRHTGQRDGWKEFEGFASCPGEFAEPHRAMVDVTGDGRADILTLPPGTIRYYESRGTTGFAPAVDVNQVEGFPGVSSSSPGELVTFCALLGDGLSHRVRVRSGLVECWPNLGHGRFGPVRHLDNAPSFDDGFDPARLRFSDTDGSGTLDIIYLHSDSVEIYRNLSGNAFAPPFSVHLPETCGDPKNIHFADIYGSGCTSLVYTVPGPPVQHLVYDFCNAEKPYLLSSITSEHGAQTSVVYRSSTGYALDCKKQGRPWRTSVPFPVQVVKTVTTIDPIADTRSTTTYYYRDGHYDPIERRFSGFSMVEARTEESVGQSETEMRDVCATISRKWFHTGAELPADIPLASVWEQEPPGPHPVEIAATSSDQETIRQAHVALKGHLLRHEVFDKNGSPQVITLHRYSANLAVPRNNEKAAIFTLQHIDTLVRTHDGDATDPRCRRQISLEVDGFGEPLLTADVRLPRKGEGAGKYSWLVSHPEQQILSVTLTRRRTVNIEGPPIRHLGIEVSHEVFALKGDLGEIWSGPDVRKLCEMAKRTLGRHADRNFTQQQDAQRLSWKRFVFWDNQRASALPFGETNEVALLHHEEEAVFHNELLACVLRTDAEKITLKEGGYNLRNDLWWRDGNTYFYTSHADHHRVSSVQDSLGGRTIVLWDDLGMFPVAVKRISPHGVELVHQAEIDPFSLLPRRIVDPNLVVDDFRFDPLGRVIAHLRHRNPDQNQLSTWQSNGALSTALSDPTGALGLASAAYYYDDPVESGRSARVLKIATDTHYDDRFSTRRPSLVLTLDGMDGHGRFFRRQICGDGAKQWEVSRLEIMTGHGLSAETYVPHFSNDSGPWSGMKGIKASKKCFDFDALGRSIATLEADGSHTKTVFMPWGVVHYDENDLHHPGAGLDVTETSGSFIDTPSWRVLDNHDRAFLHVELETCADQAEPNFLISRMVFDNHGNVIAEYDPRLECCRSAEESRKKFPKDDRWMPESREFPNANRRQIFDMAGRLLIRHGADDGFQRFLPDAKNRPWLRWSGRGARETRCHDILDRLVRVHMSDCFGDNNEMVQRFAYDDDLVGARDRLVRLDDQVGSILFSGFDINGKPQKEIRRFLSNMTFIADWGDESKAALEEKQFVKTCKRDAFGREVNQDFSEGGSVTRSFDYAGRLTSLAWRQTASGSLKQIVKTASYDAMGRQHVIEYGNGVRFMRNWHASRPWLLEQMAVSSASSTLLKMKYGYDSTGNVLKIETQGEIAKPREIQDHFTYDSIYRLRSAIRAADDFSQSYRQDYAYDQGGNLTELKHAPAEPGTATTRRFTIAPESNRWQTDEINPEFDVDGNLLRLDGDTNLTWSRCNTLISLRRKPHLGRLLAEDYASDYRGCRQRRMVRIDPDVLPPTREMPGSSAWGIMQATECLHVGSLRIRRERNNYPLEWRQTGCSLHLMDGHDTLCVIDMPAGKEAELRFHLLDHQGSSLGETDADGKLVCTERYYPFGASAQAEDASGGRKRGFVSKEKDVETGLYDFGFRIYAPELGRWLNPDPAGFVDGYNQYAFVRNNPVTWRDVTGLMVSMGFSYQMSHGNEPPNGNVIIQSPSTTNNQHPLLPNAQEPRISLGPFDDISQRYFGASLLSFFSTATVALPRGGLAGAGTGITGAMQDIDNTRDRAQILSGVMAISAGAVSGYELHTRRSPAFPGVPPLTSRNLTRLGFFGNAVNELRQGHYGAAIGNTFIGAGVSVNNNRMRVCFVGAGIATMIISSRR